MNALVWVLLVEWALTAVAAILCVAALGLPWRQPDRQVAWHLAVVTGLAGVEAATLFAVAVRWRMPLLLFAVLYGAGAVVMLWRLWLVLLPRLRRR